MTDLFVQFYGERQSDQSQRLRWNASTYQFVQFYGERPAGQSRRSRWNALTCQYVQFNGDRPSVWSMRSRWNALIDLFVQLSGEMPLGQSKRSRWNAFKASAVVFLWLCAPVEVERFDSPVRSTWWRQAAGSAPEHLGGQHDRS